MNSELLDINISNDEIFRHMELLRDNVSSMILEVLNINRYIDNEFINLRKYIEINNFVNDDLIKFYNKIENLITMEESQIGSINKVFTKINELSSSIENSHMINEKKFIAFANCINNNLKDNLVKVKNEEERIIKISEELQKISNSKETITNRYIKIIKKLNNLSDTAQSLVKIFKVNK